MIIACQRHGIRDCSDSFYSVRGPRVSAPITSAHLDNLVRWSPDQSAGMSPSLPKVQYAGLSSRVLVPIHHSTARPGAHAFEVWAIVFDSQRPERSFALKQQVRPADVLITRDHLALQFGDNVMAHGHSVAQATQTTMSGMYWSLPEDGLRHFQWPTCMTGIFQKLS